MHNCFNFFTHTQHLLADHLAERYLQFAALTNKSKEHYYCIWYTTESAQIVTVTKRMEGIMFGYGLKILGGVEFLSSATDILRSLGQVTQTLLQSPICNRGMIALISLTRLLRAQTH